MFAQAVAVFEEEEVGILQVLRGQTVLAGEGMTGGRGEQELVIEQRHRLDAGGVIGKGDEGGVEGAGLELVDQAAGAVLVEIELQVRVFFGQQADGLGQDEGRDRRNGAEVERSGEYLSGRGDGLDEGVGIGEQGRGAGGGDFAGMGEGGAAGLALGKRDAEQVLELLDAGREGGLGDMAGFGGAGKRAGFAQGDEKLELAECRKDHRLYLYQTEEQSIFLISRPAVCCPHKMPSGSGAASILPLSNAQTLRGRMVIP